MIDDPARFRLAHLIRKTVETKEMSPRQWADIFRYMTGDTTPVMSMRDGVAQKVLDFYEIEDRKQKRLN